MGRFKIGGVTGGSRLIINAGQIASSNNGFDPLMRTWTYSSVGMRPREYGSVGFRTREYRSVGMKTWAQKV